MIRKLLLGTVVAGVGYIIGLLFGYRAAVTDYVENDARTLQSMAQTMYDTRTLHELAQEDLSDEEIEQLPEEVQSYLEGDEDDESEERRGFQ
jgi:hypothetical protein